MTGFLCLDKPEGMTSFSAVHRVRRLCGLKKAGHTSTLDPMATGVLPVMLGGATKFAEYIPSAPKGYTADLLLGVETDTYDVTGAVLSQRDADVPQARMEEVLAQFTGTQMQTPPMYSAISQNGVRLYKLARQGIEVERPARQITVYEAKVLAHPAKDVYTVSFLCSEGTYIRSLAHDLGEALGCGACLQTLRRTSSNGFTAQEALTLAEIETLLQTDALAARIRSVEDVMRVYPSVQVTPAQAKRFANGGALALDRLRGAEGEGLRRVYTQEQRFLGLGSVNPASGSLEVARLYLEEV